MHTGQQCLVKWDNNNGTHQWYRAIIKTPGASTADVIWESGDFEGYESVNIHICNIILRENIFNEVVEIKLTVSETKELVTRNSHKIDSIIKTQEGFTTKVGKIGKLVNIFEKVLTRFDELNEKVDLLNRNFMENTIFNDEVNYDVDRLKDSLNSLASVHMYSSGEQEPPVRKKYYSTPELFTDEKLSRYNE